MIRSLLFLLLAPAVAIGDVVDTLETALGTTVRDLRQHFCPDRRVAVFDINWTRMDSAVILRGEVDNVRAHDSLLTAVRPLAPGGIVDSVLVLPSPALGAKTYGIIVLSVANIRSKPGESEELGTQATMGAVVKVLKRGPGYYYVQCADQYLGWLDGGAFFPTDRAGVDAWAATNKVILTDYFQMVREKPTNDALPVCDAVIGNIFKRDGVENGWTAIELADGRKGYLPSSSLMEHAAWRETRHLSSENVERTAQLFVGVPYLWGGTSSKGMDCSGFTKTVYRLNGTEINRDASQQVLNGRDVDPGKNFENLRKGDLLFFGRQATEGRPERIVHVAIYLDHRRFIHSSGRVRFSSFDPASPEFDEYNLKRFVRARRIIPESTVPER